MLVQLSAGTGPVECGIAVAKIYRALARDFGRQMVEVDIAQGGHPDFPIIRYKREKRHGDRQVEAFRSILFEADKRILPISNGSICWRCESPIRKGYPRKNWYVDVSLIPEAADIPFDSGDLEISFFHCGGKGGQNVNKVETGVRLKHRATGIITESTEERTQVANRRKAYEKMLIRFSDMREQVLAGQRNYAWTRHNDLERGNPMIIYEGMGCVRAKG